MILRVIRAHLLCWAVVYDKRRDARWKGRDCVLTDHDTSHLILYNTQLAKKLANCIVFKSSGNTRYPKDIGGDAQQQFGSTFILQ